MSSPYRCWKCGADLGHGPLSVGRRDECPACGAALHACRRCRHYDTGKAKQCREPVAEAVSDKTRGNFCEWFQASSKAFSPAESRPDSPLDALNALFSAPSAPSDTPQADDPRAALDRLFKP